MKIYTSQIYKIKGKREYLDITVQSGDLRLAPTWEMVNGIKDKTMSKKEYISKYKEKMNLSIKNNLEYWLDLINKDELVLACYCKAYEFCHRYILVIIIEDLCKKYNVPFLYGGEID